MGAVCYIPLCLKQTWEKPGADIQTLVLKSVTLFLPSWARLYAATKPNQLGTVPPIIKSNMLHRLRSF